MEQSESTKEEIKSTIIKVLNKQFDPQLYYTASLYDILESKGEFFEKYIEYATSSTKRRSFESVITGKKDQRFPELGALINLCFKYDINTSGPEFEKFKQFGDYYKWLFDIEGFDYKLFVPLWVTEYQTKYYIEKIKSHPIIRENIASYLKDNQDPQLERFYFELTSVAL